MEFSPQVLISVGSDRWNIVGTRAVECSVSALTTDITLHADRLEVIVDQDLHICLPQHLLGHSNKYVGERVILEFRQSGLSVNHKHPHLGRALHTDAEPKACDELADVEDLAVGDSRKGNLRRGSLQLILGSRPLLEID